VVGVVHAVHVHVVSSSVLIGSLNYQKNDEKERKGKRKRTMKEVLENSKRTVENAKCQNNSQI